LGIAIWPILARQEYNKEPSFKLENSILAAYTVLAYAFLYINTVLQSSRLFRPKLKHTARRQLNKLEEAHQANQIDARRGYFGYYSILYCVVNFSAKNQLFGQNLE